MRGSWGLGQCRFRRRARPHHPLARLRRVNAQLALWDELDAMALMPPGLRPWAEVPVLDHQTLKTPRAEPVAALEASFDGSAQPLMTDSTWASSNGFA